ncbi:hypothetical protein CFAM422_006022 [Trichoderma lentiforme]|uniref:Uncharacterized protein n=1 Tax=Trichoderma lentiforme TaxID=1567552 RepID=A0A9P4XGE2_9HYPO|nr:hypothetical protein CFAM422_006022 [Trichoderma lentiforme]
MHRPNEALGDLQTARQKRPAWIAIYRAFSAREPHRSSSRDMSDLCDDATVHRMELYCDYWRGIGRNASNGRRHMAGGCSQLPHGALCIVPGRH